MTPQASSRPNILLIVCHDLGQHLGCYGWPVDTPNLDRLAAEGIRFENYFCTAPQCSPSRGSILTGRYPHSNGLMGLVNVGGWRLPEHETTLPKVLRQAGYDTWLWGFQHEHTDPSALGYDHDPIGHTRGGGVPKIMADYVAPRLCEWLHDTPGQPFLASVGFFETHIPFHKGPVSSEMLARIKPLPYLPDHPAIRQDIAELQCSVRVVDTAVGRILATLDATGLAESTIVVFTCDHGIPFPRAKCTLYDPGVKTTLLMRWPGQLAQNRVVSNLLSNIDLLPTLLDMVGVPISQAVQGRSFDGLARGGTYVPRDHVFTEMTWHGGYDPMRSIRTHRYKFIRHFDPLRRNRLPGDYYRSCAGAEYLSAMLDVLPPERELFDLAADPHEQHNLANRHGYRELADELEARLLAWMCETDDPLLDGPVDTPEPVAHPIV